MGKTKEAMEPQELYACFDKITELLSKAKICCGERTGAISHFTINDSQLPPAVSIDGYSSISAFTSAFSRLLLSSFEQVKDEISKVNAIRRPRYVHEASQYLEVEFDSLFQLLQKKISRPILAAAPQYQEFDGALQLTTQGLHYMDEVEKMEKVVKRLLSDKLETLSLLLREFMDKRPTLAGGSEDRVIYIDETANPEVLAILYRLLTLETRPLLYSQGGLANFRRAFSDKSSDFEQLRWLGNNDELRYLIVKLAEDPEPVIKFNQPKKWSAIEAVFCKKDGSVIRSSSLAGNTKPPKTAMYIDGIVAEVRRARGKRANKKQK